MRVHIAAGMPLPDDLGEWTLRNLSEAASADYLRLQRDVWLLRASSMIGGSLRQRALGILAENARLSRNWSSLALSSPDPGTPRGAVHAARLILPIPAERRLRAIIANPRGSWQAGAL